MHALWPLILCAQGLCDPLYQSQAMPAGWHWHRQAVLQSWPESMLLAVLRQLMLLLQLMLLGC